MKLLNLLAAVALFLTSCQSFPGFVHEVKGVPPQNVVMIDTNGRIVDPTGDRKCYEDDDWKRVLNGHLRQYEIPHYPELSERPCLGSFRGLVPREITDSARYINDIIDEIHRYHATTKAGQKREIAIIVHGGLNNTRTNLEFARDVTAKMMRDPSAPYPIFILWESNLWGSLWDHLVKVRQGDSKGFRHWYIGIPYLAADLAKGVARAPATWFYHYANDIERVKMSVVKERKRTDDIYCDLRQQYLDCAGDPDECESIRISKGPFAHTRTEGFWSTLKNGSTNLVPPRYYGKLAGIGGNRLFGWLPVKLIVAPFLDGLGTSAWDAMIRHVQLGFHNDGVANPGRAFEVAQTVEGLPATIYQPAQGNGGVSQFLRALSEEIRRTSCSAKGADPEECLSWDLSLIGHSMGAIMSNHILYEFKNDLAFNRIVYMAAACSVNDYERNVLEYMKANGDTEMYHLILHDFAEIRDQYAFELPPSGSLLVWIDNFLSKPATLRDRTAGRFVNLMLALPATPATLRPRIHVKTFGVGKKLAYTDPLHHGDFNDFTGYLLNWEVREKRKQLHDPRLRFWDSKFWEPHPFDEIVDKANCPPGKAKPANVSRPAETN